MASRPPLFVHIVGRDKKNAQAYVEASDHWRGCRTGEYDAPPDRGGVVKGWFMKGWRPAAAVLRQARKKQ
eukprot:3319102-Lingulodinium_polyedra.AAC.1